VRICHFVYDLILGGTEGQCARTAMALAASAVPGEAHRVAVFFRRGGHLEAVERATGPVVEVPVRHFVGRATAAAVRDFAAFLVQEKIDILHAWDADAAIFGQFAAAKAGCRFATSRRDLGEIYPLHKRLLLARADRKAAKVVVNAERIEERFRATGKTVLIGNLFDFASFAAAAEKPFSKEKELPPGKRTAVVSRLDREKNVGLLVEALRFLPKEASLVVAGDGVERASLEARAAELGLQNRIAFLGDIPDVPALLRQVDAASLVPRANEGQSNAVLEYLASGLPVLATDCGGNKELLSRHARGRSELIAPDATPEAAAEAWRRVLSFPRREAAPLAGHSPDEVAGAFRAMYRDILAGA